VFATDFANESASAGESVHGIDLSSFRLL